MAAKTNSKPKKIVKKKPAAKPVRKPQAKKMVVKKTARKEATFESDKLPKLKKKKKSNFKGYVFDPTDMNVTNYLHRRKLKIENFTFIINRLACGKTIAETLDSYRRFVPKTKMLTENIRRIEIRFDDIITALKKKREIYLAKKVARNLQDRLAGKLSTNPNKKKKKSPRPWDSMMDNIGVDGLPELPNSLLHRPNYEQLDMPIDKLFQKLSQYSKPELRSIIAHRYLDGQSLSMQTLSLAQMYLDTLHSNPRVRSIALKYIIERRYGPMQTRIANGDGSNIHDAFSALIDPNTAKLKPAKT